MTSRVPNGLKGVTSEKTTCKALGKCSRKKWEWGGKTSESKGIMPFLAAFMKSSEDCGTTQRKPNRVLIEPKKYPFDLHKLDSVFVHTDIFTLSSSATSPTMIYLSNFTFSSIFLSHLHSINWPRQKSFSNRFLLSLWNLLAPVKPGVLYIFPPFAVLSYLYVLNLKMKIIKASAEFAFLFLSTFSICYISCLWHEN